MFVDVGIIIVLFSSSCIVLDVYLLDFCVVVLLIVFLFAIRVSGFGCLWLC